MACCGTNTWNAAQGSATVFINGKPAVRLGDQTKHCGGVGKMIEGSPNVVIGGSATVGPGANVGAAGRGGGGQGGGSTTGRSFSSSSARASSARGGDPSRNAGSPDNSAGGTSNTSSATQDLHDPDKFTLWLKPDAINGGTLAGETVEIIDPETKEVVAEIEVDADGNVLASVPENKPYDLQILGTAHVIPGEGIEDESLVNSQLHVTLYDPVGESLAAGVKVIVRGMGQVHELFTAVDGSISPQLEAGIYDIEVNGQTFSAHTLRGYDLAHEGGASFEFQLTHDGSEPDYAAIESGRSHRLTADDIEEA